ncbi:MAG: polysaccharide deacetylase family protein [Bacteroidota bacterium]|nr:polysaccharide deacetylase family protein [Bacteroidota bacterium]
MNLQVGITKLEPGWETILKQIGVPYRDMSNIQGTELAEFASIIVSKATDHNDRLALLNYVKSGGTIITEADLARTLFGIPVKRVYLKYIVPDQDGIFKRLPPVFIDRRCNVPLDATYLESNTGSRSCLEQFLGKGKMFVFPSPFSSLMLDHAIKRKEFYSAFGKKETTERVSSISKGSIRFYVQAALEDLFHFRTLPFVSLWHFPDGERAICSFRIDTDFASQDDIKNLFTVCSRNSIPATWFVETASSEQWLNVFAALKNQEIGLHCHRHKIFQRENANRENINRGLTLLRERAGIVPAGFAAPYGEWRASLSRALDHSHFLYSSEFGYAYDSLPCYPYENNSFATVLQVPIHPISVGRLAWGGHSDEAMVRYFEDVISQKLQLFDPIILYTHPGENRFHVFNAIFKRIRELNIPVYTLKEYAEWWKKKEAVHFSAIAENGNLVIAADSYDTSLWVRISYPEKEIYVCRLQPTMNFTEKRITEARLENASFLNDATMFETTVRMRWHDIIYRWRKYKQ